MPGKPKKKRIAGASSEDAVPENEHIFPATRLTKLAIRWKEIQGVPGKEREAMDILDEIIQGSAHMFQRLSQHEGYHRTVELDSLVAAANDKMVKWLLRWSPKKGRLFSWLSKCSKNAFRSEVGRVATYRSRYHATGDNLEAFFGAEDHEVDKEDAAREVRAALNNIFVRWGCPQEQGAVKYCLECILESDSEDRRDKAAAIRGAAYAWGISPELAKFFYGWALMELRNQFHRKTSVRFSEQDLFRHANTYTHLVDLLDIITWDQLKKMIVVMGGTRLKIPTVVQMAKLCDDYELYRDIEDSDLDPSSIEDIAKRRRRSQRTAEQSYQEMCEVVKPDRSGEYPLYDG